MMRGFFPEAEQRLALALECAAVIACLSDWRLCIGCSAAIWMTRILVCNHALWQLAMSGIGVSMACTGSWIAHGWMLAYLGALISTLGLVSQLLFPIPTVRRPTIVPIGRTSFIMEDRCGRDNTVFDPSDSRPRKIVASLFYPCIVPAVVRWADLYDDFSKVGDALIGVLPAVPNFMKLFSKHVNGPSSAYLDAEVVRDRKLPLVILLHGITGPRWQYVSLAERLAESGFLCCAIEHPGDTACCLCYGNEQPVLYALGRPPKDIPSETSAEWAVWHGHLQNRVLDTHKVLLPWLRESPFDARIEWGCGVSLVGHSFGAAEALELVWRYPETYLRCALHDAWLYPSSRELRTGTARFAADVLSITSEKWNWKRNLRRVHSVVSTVQLGSQRAGRRIKLVLKNAGHHNFHDIALIVPRVAKWLGMLGKDLDAACGLMAVNETTLSFLQVSMGHDASQRDLRAVSGDLYEEIGLDESSWDHYHDEFHQHE